MKPLMATQKIEYNETKVIVDVILVQTYSCLLIFLINKKAAVARVNSDTPVSSLSNKIAPHPTHSLTSSVIFFAHLRPMPRNTRCYCALCDVQVSIPSQRSTCHKKGRTFHKNFRTIISAYNINLSSSDKICNKCSYVLNTAAIYLLNDSRYLLQISVVHATNETYRSKRIKTSHGTRDIIPFNIRSMVRELSVFEDPFMNSRIIFHTSPAHITEEVLDWGHPSSEDFIGVDVTSELKKSQKYNDLKKKEGKLIVKPSYSGDGLFTEEDIEKGREFLEYQGTRISKRESNKREKFYEGRGLKRDYMLEVTSEKRTGRKIIDGTVDGNCAIFINHSCDPNCEFVEINCSGTIAVYLAALSYIPKGEQLSIDYRMKINKDERKRIKCLCKSPKCRGYLC